MSSSPQVRLIPATVPLLNALNDESGPSRQARSTTSPRTLCPARIRRRGFLVSLGFEHVDDQEDPEVGAVWEWRWTRPSEEPANPEV